jgi:hypothetical protein
VAPAQKYSVTGRLALRAEFIFFASAVYSSAISAYHALETNNRRNGAHRRRGGDWEEDAAQPQQSAVDA